MPRTNVLLASGITDTALAGADLAPPDPVFCPGCETGPLLGGEPRCEDCVICARCGDTVPEDDTVQTLRGSTICDTCRPAWYWQCSSCDGWNRDGRDCANGCCSEDCACSSCRDDEDDDRDGRVYDYEYKPSPLFHGDGPLFLGHEIEIQTPSGDWECAELANSHLGSLGYLKNDCSIGGGFEIVTHPMSYEWAIENFPWQMLTELREMGCAVTASTGIHVHVSRAGFSSAGHTYRWMKFIYRNQAQVTAVARRTSHHWAAFTDQDRKAVKDYAKGVYGERYRAINTGNRDTFELRVFASSLNPREVQATLGFAAASVEYTRGLTVHQITHRDGWAWAAFAEWVASKPLYAPLAEQMEALSCAC